MARSPDRRRAIAALSGVLAAAASAACLGAGPPAPAYRWRLPAGVAPPPVPADNPMSEAKVELGRRLFYDADLSIDGTMSCATCHEQKRAFTEGNRTHPGVRGDPGRRNVMALADVGYFRTLTWADPTQRTLEAQVAVPVLGEHPVEMGMAGQEAALAERLAGDASYRQAFAAAFPERSGRIDMESVAKAVAAFERTLISLDAPYDRYRRGDKAALTDQAKRGAALFFSSSVGCSGCHQGLHFTDAFGSGGKGLAGYHWIEPYRPAATDRGLAEVTGEAADIGRIRTPSLRNVELSGPYLHDGSAATLAQAIGRHNNGYGALSDGEVQGLVAFLHALTDRAFVTDPRFALLKADRP